LEEYAYGHDHTNEVLRTAACIQEV